MASLCKNLRLARHGENYISHRLGAMRTFSSNRTLIQTRPYLQVKSDQSNLARFLAPRALHNIAPQTGDDETGFVTKVMPAHYLVQIDSFSMLEKHDKFETSVFEAGGYDWKLKIYNDRDNAKSVPVTLALQGTSAWPKRWELQAAFSIYLENQISGSYFSVLGKVCLDATKTECGGFFPKHFLTNPSYGYLKRDMCVFGAEVFINRNELVYDYMSLMNLKPPPYRREFKIPNFPSLKEGGGWVWTSEVFSVGGHKWMLKVLPNMWERGIGSLSIFIENIVDSDNDDSLRVIEVHCTMTLKSQNDDNVKSNCGSCRFSASKCDGLKWPFFIDLASLYDPDKGFILNGCVHLALELSVEEIG